MLFFFFLFSEWSHTMRIEWIRKKGCIRPDGDQGSLKQWRNISQCLRTRLTLLYRSTLASTSPPCRAKLTQKYNLKAGQPCSRPSCASQTSPDLILILQQNPVGKDFLQSILKAQIVLDCQQCHSAPSTRTGRQLEDRRKIPCTHQSLTSDPRTTPLGVPCPIFIMKMVKTRVREEPHLIQSLQIFCKDSESITSHEPLPWKLTMKSIQQATD